MADRDDNAGYALTQVGGADISMLRDNPCRKCGNPGASEKWQFRFVKGREERECTVCKRNRIRPQRQRTHAVTLDRDSLRAIFG